MHYTVLLYDLLMPYTALLDHINLNPSKNKYHNTKYKDIRRTHFMFILEKIG